MQWRLGLDLGEASIGWAAFRLDPNTREVAGLLDGGVRLFSNGRNPKNNQPLNLDRRTARGMRRQASRRLQRNRSVETWLVQCGLLDSYDHQVRHLNPYQARAESADPSKAVSKEMLARAMLHLAKSRGFKSNRKSQDAAESNLGQKGTELEQAVGDLTLGQWLYDRQQADLAKVKEAKAKCQSFHHRARLKFSTEGEYFPTRKLILAEFDAIRIAQQPNQNLSEEQWDELRHRVFWQRELKPQERGKCTLYPTRDRALKALVSSQEFRIEQALSNIRYSLPDNSQHALDHVQRAAIRAELHTQQTMTYGKILKLKNKSTKAPLFPDATGINFPTKDKVEGATTWQVLESVLGSETLTGLSDDQLDQLVTQLVDGENADQVIDWLVTEGLDHDQAVQLEKASNRLPTGTANLCSHAIVQLLPLMRDGQRYDQAVTSLVDDQGQPLHHSVFTSAKLPEGSPLPYYGALLPSAVIGGDQARFDAEKHPEQHFGRIMNPTVHVALRQLQRVVNALIERYGHPTQLHIELAREIGQGEKQRTETKRKQDQNRKKNERLDSEIRKLGVLHPTRDDRVKYELWEMGGVERTCVFSGKQISAEQLFKTGETEIEHLLPYSRTLDDRRSNKVVVFKWANAFKGNKTPFEAFGENQHPKIQWEDVIQRADKLPDAWKWRFGPDAMDRFFKDGKNVFVERSLNDTRYLARVAKKYLEAITDEPVVVVTGQHTANLRHDWRLNQLLHPADADDHTKKTKNRGDHRHHLVDAFVIGLTTRSALMAMSKAERSMHSGKMKRGYADIDQSMRSRLIEVLDHVTISLRSEHNARGKMLDETAYGAIQPPKDMEQDRTLVTRVNVAGIRANPEATLGVSKVKGICDPAIRLALNQYLEAEMANGTKEKDALKAFLNGPLVEMIEQRDIKRLRVAVKDQTAQFIPSAPFKAYSKAGYAFADVWFLPKNAQQKQEKYEAVFVDMPTAIPVLEKGQKLSKSFRPKHPAARRLMRLFKNDVIELDTDEGRSLFRVFGFSATNNRLDIRPLSQADATQKFESVNTIGTRNPIRMQILPDGSIVGRNQ